MGEPRRHPLNTRAAQKKLQAQRDIKNAVFAATEPLEKRIRELEEALRQGGAALAAEQRANEELRTTLGMCQHDLESVRNEIDTITKRRPISDTELAALAAEVYAEGRPVTAARRRMMEELQRRGIADGPPDGKPWPWLRQMATTGIVAAGVYALTRHLHTKPETKEPSP